MSDTVCLSEVPGKFLNRYKWNSLLKSAPEDITALSYINAPFHDDEGPGDDEYPGAFWDQCGSRAAAIRWYWIGRSLLNECRSLLIEGKLVAMGANKDGIQTTISPREWLNLWPMFATEKAVGPNSEYSEVKVFEAASTGGSYEKMLFGCIAWLRGQKIAVPKSKRIALFQDARLALGDSMTHAIFSANYDGIYAEADFTDLSYFNRSSRRHFGATPSDIRTRAQRQGHRVLYGGGSPQLGIMS